MVSLNETFKVCDHDFTHFSLIPSVSLLIDVPDRINGSWYEGEVHVGFKDNCPVVCGTYVSFMMMCFSQGWETSLFSLCTQTEDQITFCISPPCFIFKFEFGFAD